MLSGIGRHLAANYRYIVLRASMVALLIGSCSIFLMAIVIKPIAGEFGRRRFIQSLAFSLQFLWAGTGPPIVLGAVMMSVAAFNVAGIAHIWSSSSPKASRSASWEPRLCSPR